MKNSKLQARENDLMRRETKFSQFGLFNTRKIHKLFSHSSGIPERNSTSKQIYILMVLIERRASLSNNSINRIARLYFSNSFSLLMSSHCVCKVFVIISHIQMSALSFLRLFSSFSILLIFLEYTRWMLLSVLKFQINYFPSVVTQLIKNEDLEELRELGSGTFGTVYHGKWRGTDVAIKRIKKSCFTGRSSEQERLVSLVHYLLHN